MNVPDKFASLCLDRAVMFFGTKLEEALEAASRNKGKSKKPMSDAEITRRRDAVFEAWFGEKKEKKFRDPMATKG